MARYHAEGVYTVLVTCTGGEEGEILNPAAASLVEGRSLPEVRLEELRRSVAVIGYDELVLLGYRDSGMEGAPSNDNPQSFHMAPLDEAVGRLVAVIRRVRPQVIITYSDEQGGYNHPDHVRVHEISVAAFDAAGDRDRYPDAGEPYEPKKLYYQVGYREQFLARHRMFEALGLESPYAERHLDRWLNREELSATTRIDVDGFTHARRDALLAHATQIDPTSRFWFGLPEDVERSIFSQELYALARSRLGPKPAEEKDLFEGI